MPPPNNSSSSNNNKIPTAIKYPHKTKTLILAIPPTICMRSKKARARP
jgi:hypothetical protein